MSRRKSVRSILGIVLVMAVAMGCSAAVATPTPTPTPAPTPTAAPTATPTATPTLEPTPTPTAGPDGFPRRFHVEGNAFVDQFDQKMLFRGVDSVDPAQQKVDPNMPAWNENYYKTMADWGANIVRVPIMPSALHRFGMDATLETLDQTIAWAGRHHLYVIIDFHSVGWIPTSWYPDDFDTTTVAEWTSFWKAISSRYANNDVVAFYELFNEPQVAERQWELDPATFPGYWMDWRGLADTLISDTIRPNDPDKIVLVGGLQNAYNLSYAAAAPIADVSGNVAYVTHPYASCNTTFQSPGSLSDWDKAFGDLSSQHPVIATEFSYGDPSMDPIIPGTDGVPWHKAIIDYLEAHHISWTVWSFSANWGPGLVTDNTTFEPSEEGVYFKSRLLELNGPPSP
jgi:hypothetical protein